ncbi:DedA family protein [Chthonobacter rhizosphaerae]|uniref:DedA family protein n=1 Tax=Chthonobacter rhizosphaerae TaxID=2735553 RepID=UPI0015EEFD3D|nr:DedA family protein [Chthonobacter rhizosphaerae]
MFEWVVGFVQQGGYLGVAFLMFLENVFPPIPSEVIMPLAGFAAARGDLNIALVILSGTIGSLAGALFWYWVGVWLGVRKVEWAIDRFGRVLTMSHDDLEKAREWFRWKASWAVFLGRLVPTVRTLISVPAGIAGMPFWSFTFWTTLGTAAWTTILAMAGYLLESQYETVEAYLDPASKVVVAVIVLAYLYRLVTYKPRAAAEK